MEIYDLLDNLKNSLNQENSIISIKNIQNEIKSNSLLMDRIRSSERINDSLVSEYRHLENDVNYIILYINSRLKDTFRSDRNESNTR